MNGLPVNGPRVELIGNRSAVVDGCDGIMDYDTERIKLRLGRMTLEITGRNLHLKALTASSAVVVGVIQGLQYGF